MDEFIGIIKIFAGNFAPTGWALCNGQLLPISQYAAVFSILGTTYGGDGRTTFGLPNLQSRVPVGMGQGPGLSLYTQGEVTGTENNSLTVNNLPAHTHTGKLTVSSGNASQAAATAGASIATPGSLNGRSFASTFGFNTATPDMALNAASVTTNPTGGNIPVNNIQPVIAVNYIICLQGIFPSRS